MVVDVQLAIYVATVLLNLSLAVAVGAAMVAFWLAKGTSAWSVAQLRRIRPVRLTASIAAIAASASLLLLVSAHMAEVSIAEAGEAMEAMLTQSHFGLAWSVGMGALLVGTLASAVQVSGKLLRPVALISLMALAVVLYTRSMVSHAAADGDLSLAIIVDWVHLCLISVWVGAVFIAALVTLPSPVGQHGTDRTEAAGYIDTLSTWATGALAGIVATGLFSSWVNLGSLAALSTTDYGSALLVKLGLVVFAILLGGFNRFTVMPSLLAGLRRPQVGMEASQRRFTRVLQIEAIVLFAVLVVAVILSATSPPTAA